MTDVVLVVGAAEDFRRRPANDGPTNDERYRLVDEGMVR